MGQSSSQMVEEPVDGDVEESVNTELNARTSIHGMLPQLSSRTHSNIEQNGLEKNILRKKGKKHKHRNVADTGQHSKEEESARTLLEMMGKQDLERTYSDEDNRAASSQILSETLLQARPDIQDENNRGAAIATNKPRKSRKHKKQKRKPVEVDNAELARLLVEDAADVSSEVLVPSSQYPEPHALPHQYQPAGPNCESSQEYDSDYNARFASVRSPARVLATQSENGKGKGRSRLSFLDSSPPPTAASLASAANAANALIDPALTAEEDSLWVRPDSPPDYTSLHSNDGSSRIANRAVQGAKKRKRRLPEVSEPPIKHGQFSKRVKLSDGPSDAIVESVNELPTRGPYTDMEISLLADFMERYREYHEISEYDLNEKIQSTNRGSESNHELWDEICAVIPYRPRQSTMKVCRRRFHNFDKRGKWTTEEDELLEQAQMEKPNKWKNIGSKLGRHAEDCRDRWRNYLKCGNNRAKDIWTVEEVDSLREAVAKCKENMREAKAKEAKKQKRKKGSSPSSGPVEENDEEMSVDLVNWAIVSEMMNSRRSRLQCMYKWKKLKYADRLEKENERKRIEEEAEQSPAAEVEPPRKTTWRIKRAQANYSKMLPGDKYELLKILSESSAYEEKNIPWRLLSQQDWRGKWSTKDRKEAFTHMKGWIENPDEMSFQDQVKNLMGQLEELYPSQLNDFYEAPSESKNPGYQKRGKGTTKQPSSDEDDDDTASPAVMVEHGWLHPSRVSNTDRPNRGQDTRRYMGHVGDGQVDEEMAQQVQLLRHA